MHPILLGLLMTAGFGQAPNVGVNPSHLRTALPNGAVILVEPAPEDRNVNIMLFASSRGMAEPKSGLRHLLEHLCVEGKDGQLDSRLESQGAFLKAETARDFMEISIACDPANYEPGLNAIKEILTPRRWTSERIQHEVEVIAQESALEDESSKLAAAAWSVAFKAAGADPVGDLAALKTATPDEVEAVRAQTFDPSRLVIVIEGPVKMGEATSDARAIVGNLKMKKVAVSSPRSAAATSGRMEIDGFGEARGEVVPSLYDPQAAAGLAATLVVASLVPDSFVTYTPSTESAVMMVGNTSRRNVIGHAIDALEPDQVPDLFVRGRALAYRWYQNMTRTPAADARLRGMLLAQNPVAKPDKLLENIVGLTVAQFQLAMAKLSHDRALIAVGGGQ